MKITHGELRGLVALAVMLTMVTLGVGFCRDSRHGEVAEDGVESMFGELDSMSVKADTVSGVNGAVVSGEREKSRRGRKSKGKTRAKTPESAPRQSPLDCENR